MLRWHIQRILPQVFMGNLQPSSLLKTLHIGTMAAVIPIRAADAWSAPEQLQISRIKQFKKIKKTVRRLMEMMLSNVELRLDVAIEKDDGYADDPPEDSPRARQDPCDSGGGDNNVPCDTSLDDSDPSSSIGDMRSMSVESSVHDAHVDRCANDTRYHANIVPGGRNARLRRKPDWYRPIASTACISKNDELGASELLSSTPSPAASSVETDGDSTATYRIKKRVRNIDSDSEADDPHQAMDEDTPDASLGDSPGDAPGDALGYAPIRAIVNAVVNDVVESMVRAPAPFIACEDSDTSSSEGSSDDSGSRSESDSDGASTAESEEAVDAGTKAKASQHPRAVVSLD